MFKSQILHGCQLYDGFISLCQKLLNSSDNVKKIDLLSVWLESLFRKHYSSFNEESSKYGELAYKIRGILNNHEGESPPFDKISKICGLSKERCNRLFRSAYNISIQGYFLNEKADHARTLLNSTQPLSDIALECGFYDQSHFSRVFKEIFQISPAKYRALLGEDRQSHTRNN